MLISPSRAQEEETRARVTRAEQESLSLHVPREKKRGLVLYLVTLCFSFLRIARAMMQKGTARRLKGNDVYNLDEYLISSEWCAGTLGGDETLCAEPVRGPLFFCVSSSFFSLSETTFGCAYACIRMKAHTRRR